MVGDSVPILLAKLIGLAKRWGIGFEGAEQTAAIVAGELAAELAAKVPEPDGDSAPVVRIAVGSAPDGGPDSSGDCPHRHFAAEVQVDIIEDAKTFMAAVRVGCVDCGRPFEFRGLKLGCDYEGAAASADRTEARLAIVPQGDPLPTIAGASGWTIQNVEPHAWRPFVAADGTEACADCYAPRTDPIHFLEVRGDEA